MSTTMHFGPEWMRTGTKHQNSRPHPPPSPTSPAHPQQAAPPPPPAAAPTSSYSALVSPAPHPQPEQRDQSHPFRYSKEDMLRIYKEGAARAGLGLEVERWEGIVREAATDPVGLSEMTESEKKLFAGPLNSELRRRQSTDYLSPLNTAHTGDRPRLNHANSSATVVSPHRERFGGLMSKRRESTDQPSQNMPRKLSLSGQAPLNVSRDGGLMSPRTRGPTTPSFDGVLNGGDSWMARRKNSEAGIKGPINWNRAEGGAGGADVEVRHNEIKEEEEDSRPDTKPNVQSTSPQQGLSESVPDHPTAAASASNDSSRSVSTATTTSLAQASGHHVGGGAGLAGPHPSHVDLAAVEWSYLDPQGQVQGPFRADIMQKWYDEGYFTPELLMKRTNFDAEWTPVGELSSRAGNDKLFLSLPLAPPAPPGLALRTQLHVVQPPHEQQQPHFPDPFQPNPTRPVRISNFDAYFSTGSNPSDSPSSSFGALSFANGSPDPGPFAPRAGAGLYAAPESSSGLARAGFSAGGAEHAPFGALRRSTLNDGPLDPALGARGAQFAASFVPARAATLDGYSVGGAYQVAQAPAWHAPAEGYAEQGFDGGLQGRAPVDGAPAYSAGYGALGSGGVGQGANFGLVVAGDAGSVDGNRMPHAFERTEYGHDDMGLPHGNVQPHGGQGLESMPANNNNLTFEQHYGNGFADARFGAPPEQHHQSYPQQLAAPFTGIQSAQLPAAPAAADPPPIADSPEEAPVQALSLSAISIAPVLPPASQPPWAPPVDPARRPGPFDAQHPTSANTVAPAPPAPAPAPTAWGRPSKITRSVSGKANDDVSPWYAASQEVIDDAWKEAPGPSSLTAANLGEHELLLLQESGRAPASNQGAAPAKAKVEDVEVAAAKPAAAPPPAKSRRKSTAPAGQPPPADAQPKASSPPAEAAGVSPPVKPAWAGPAEDDAKKARAAKPAAAASPAPMGIREIQEAEAKKAEARKLAERERAARATATATLTASPSEDSSQPFTASWGLPTSQAGTRGGGGAPAKEGSNGAGAPAVWTGAAKAAPATKKTMKEIQEEEERRKKAAVKETVAAAARRAYAETTTKVVPSVSSNSAWSTVGANGKASAPPASVRPAVTTSVSAPNVTTTATTAVHRAVNGQAASRPPAVAAAPAKPAAPRVDDSPAGPSHEFMKWLAESLKGLNSSVNLEEITSMLLQFPLDPPPSTTEIISDLIYANSTMLDGRRFAADFVARRKADAATRPKGAAAAAGAGAAGGAAGVRPVSIADVVRAQPKASQPEWGGFKVVNKKKKGGRA